MAKNKKKKKNSKKETQPNYLAQTLDIALTVAVAAGLIYCGYRVAAGGVKIDQSFSESYGTGTEITETEPETEASACIEVEVDNASVHEGELILVNDNYAYEASDKDLVSLFEVKSEQSSHSFSVRDSELKVKPVMADALITMLNDFYEETYDDNINVISGYRSIEDQELTYQKYESGEEEGETSGRRAAKPGYSEHHTGYSVDFELFGGVDYDGTGVYTWIDEHCADYGLILRYPEDKTDITAIMYEPWHYRYVGAPHSNVIMDKGLCLEEYIDLVKEYSFEGEHMMASGSDGTLYEIYYCPMDSSQDKTVVQLPNYAENYTIQGNNVDGFIITINTGETSAADPAEEESKEDEDASEEDAEEATEEEAADGSDAEDA